MTKADASGRQSTPNKPNHNRRDEGVLGQLVGRAVPLFESAAFRFELVVVAREFVDGTGLIPTIVG